MASDTAPAAAGTPNNTPEAPAHPTPAAGPGQATEQPQQTGFLAGLLAPVEPARTSADYHTEPTPETAVSDATSADYHDTNTDTGTKTGNKQDSGKNSQQNGIIRAWMLAGAERWKKGGDARLVRAQMQKVKAAAQQTKETRTVTVNRSEGNASPVSAGSKGGGSGKSGGSSGNGAGKSLNSKSRTSNNGPGNSPKNNSAQGHDRSHGSKNDPGSGPGRGQGGGHRGGGGGNGGRGAGGDRSSNRHAKDQQAKTPKAPKGLTPAGHSRTPAPGKGPTEPKAPKGPKHAKADTSGASPRGNHTPKQSGDGKASARGPADAPGGTSGSKTSKRDQAPGSERAPKGNDNKAPTRSTDDRTEPPPRRRISLTKNNRNQKQAAPASNDASKNSPKTTKPDATEKPESKKASSDAKPRTPDAPASPAGGKRLDVRESREAGYRDGVRYGTVTAHMGAYRDGWNDGRTDTKQAAAQEKKRLDTARDQRKKQNKHPIPPKPTDPPAAHTDLMKPAPQEASVNTPPPTPSPLVTATTVNINRPDGSHINLSRGEVRNLASFQRRLAAKADAMTRVADRARALHQAAVEQTRVVTRLLEQSKGVKSGAKVAAALTRLQEQAKAQETAALDAVKRATRAAEATRTLAANTSARYDGIYRAVVDSPETLPAELSYYRDMGVTR
ncbi:hypothetical protein [Streptomyces sp. NPDC060243]|uniref:hypothetical protein n=1 Tax=Streptomyces sp. NPDC060243 TaxID=3347081 RepID=UPI0036698047